MSWVVVALQDPKYKHNVGAVFRAAAAYGVTEVLWTGDRVNSRPDGKGTHRLPREERLRAYDVKWTHLPDHFQGPEQGPGSNWTAWPRELTPVCVELVPGAEPLSTFEHPENAMYLFGPEDGWVSKRWRAEAHRFVFIPTRHCVNLAAAVYTVLYDRQTKRQLAGLEPILPMDQVLARLLEDR